MSATAEAGDIADIPEATAVLDQRRIALTADKGWKLIGGKCRSCGKITHPRRARCIICGGIPDTVDLRPEGTAITATTVLMTRPDVLIKVPFQIVMVELADGPVVRMPSAETRLFERGEAVEIASLVVTDSKGVVTQAFQAKRPTKAGS